MAQLGLACKATSRACAKAGIAGLFGLAGEVNSTGDDQKKLDVLSDEIFVSALINSGACAVLVSEVCGSCPTAGRATAYRRARPRELVSVCSGLENAFAPCLPPPPACWPRLQLVSRPRHLRSATRRLSCPRKRLAASASHSTRSTVRGRRARQCVPTSSGWHMDPPPCAKPMGQNRRARQTTLTGSSNIDCNVSTGTIFAVYEKLPESHLNDPTEADIMRTGNDIVVAGAARALSSTRGANAPPNSGSHSSCALFLYQATACTARRPSSSSASRRSATSTGERPVPLPGAFPRTAPAPRPTIDGPRPNCRLSCCLA